MLFPDVGSGVSLLVQLEFRGRARSWIQTIRSKAGQFVGGPETLELYRMRPHVQVWRQGHGWGGRVRYSRLQEAAPREGTYAYSMLLGLGERLGEQMLELVRTKARWDRL